ncbi:MAG: hypothetical protein LBJ77_03615 [Holosporales bacterium]|nr:hypothetical protein [Holosporales bacterium]
MAECRSGVPPPVLISDWIHGGGMLWYPGADSFPSWLWDYFQFADYSSPGLSLAWVQAFLNCGFVLPAVPRSYEGTLLSYVCGYWYEYEYGSKGGSPSDFLFDPSGKLIPENLVLKTELSFLQDEVENLTDEVQNLEVRLRKASVIGVVFAAGFVGICCWNSFLKKPNSMISFHKLK